MLVGIMVELQQFVENRMVRVLGIVLEGTVDVVSKH
jgi:hypothetical protein